MYDDVAPILVAASGIDMATIIDAPPIIGMAPTIDANTC